ncbi:hypothetical protein ACQ4PT_064435 [Festuca glaucescens]
MDSLIDDEYDGEDMLAIEWNREAPELTEGTIFQSMVDCRNAVTTRCILSENTYEIKRSEPGKFTVFCPYDRCRWRLHASHMLKSKLIQIKKNPHKHACPPGGGGGKAKTKLAKTRWVVDAILDWLREEPGLGPTTLHAKLFEKYEIKIPYMRIFNARGRALDRINVDASFGEEERWTAANAEENAAAMEIEDAEENAAILEIEANEAVPAPCSREKRPRDEETKETEVQPSSDGLEFKANAFDGFEAIREEEEGVIVPVVLLKIVEPTDDRQLVVKCSASGSTPSAPPRPQPHVKKNKKSISTWETRSKSVKPAANTRSKSKI